LFVGQLLRNREVAIARWWGVRWSGLIARAQARGLSTAVSRTFRAKGLAGSQASCISAELLPA